MYSWYDIVQIMKRWIDESIEEPPTLAQMARNLGYSYCYAAKKFHEVEGISFREYVSGRKMRRAADDLYRTSERVMDVAIRYGYSSQEAFTRAFVQAFGIGPAAYRRLQKPTAAAEKSALLGGCGRTVPQQRDGGNPMKLYVKQMYDWNCYAYFAEDVQEQYWDYFTGELWWQLGDGFIKQFDNVKDFEYCAKNFTQYGQTAISQQLKLQPAPWQKALDLFIDEINKLDVRWYVHGSTAMALWGLDVSPRDVNIILPNASDFDTVRNHFYKMAIKPIQRCDNWLMSALGDIFLEAVVTLAFHNKELEPYDMGRLAKVAHRGGEVYVSSLEMLRQDNCNLNRPERVRLIQEKIAQIGGT
ncbi:MAG: helix-turn-helix domain-containing protein [Eubacteriales bacterium]|nr:helix-turn-helix domain-containing protein [Eubacteriales bacterium]